jgi:hypothetical protein
MESVDIVHSTKAADHTLAAFPFPDIDTREFYVSPIGTIGNAFVDFLVIANGHSMSLSPD